VNSVQLYNACCCCSLLKYLSNLNSNILCQIQTSHRYAAAATQTCFCWEIEYGHGGITYKGATMHTLVEINPGSSQGGSHVPAFLAKLWKLVDDTPTNDLIYWSEVSLVLVDLQQKLA
jgi:hypothetical protein